MNLSIKLSNVEEVQRFVSACGTLPCEADLKAGRNIVDAKSIVGVCSVDLSRKLDLEVYTDNESDVEILKDFVVA